MKDENLSHLLNQTTKSIDSGINYLYEHQLPNGEFCLYYSPDEQMKEWCVPDSSVFAACLVASSLFAVQDHPKANLIISSAVNFLQYQMMRGGVWNHYTRWNFMFKYCPADVDNIAYASYILKKRGIAFPSNTAVLLNNRNAKGIFYTWIVLRPRLNLSFLKVAARELKYLLNTVLFWTRHDARRKDIDAVVNANALFCLDLESEKEPIVKYLIDVVRNENETEADSWYKNPFTLYCSISRSYKIVSEFESIRGIIISRIYKSYHQDGSFGNSPLETALAVSTLINFNYEGDLSRSIQYLINSQMATGCWERRILFYSGPSKVVGWGSEEVSTGYVVEALAAFYNLKNELN